ncbi:uncharacterized protein LOC120283434 isoform X4 [Dioscorea cayenensis subsp. rotundata]|nr:uncharacterized protein LOC120283434 isoform X4 [Dioscorea cayenensis subsp. rotundata]
MKMVLLHYPNPPLLPIYANLSMRWHLDKNTQEEFLKLPSISMNVSRNIVCMRNHANSKKSVYQDFKDFVKPLCLLAATKPNTTSRHDSEKKFSSVEVSESDALYVVELHTSKDFGSCLRDLNAAILFCLIDKKGYSILQRISAASYVNLGEEKVDSSDSINFKRGSVDIVTFAGPKLGKLEALWIGVESGSWRMDGLHVAVINGPLSFGRSIDEVKKARVNGMQYKFEVDNMPLGEGGVSVANMRPVLSAEFFSDNILRISSLNFSQCSRLETVTHSNEESMQEYKDLKLSLLIYDTLLITAGFMVTSTAISSEAGYAFLVGGMAGLLYLLLLQRLVDGLPIDSTTDATFYNFRQTPQRLQKPLFSFALILIISLSVVKYGIAGASVSLTPMELLLGAAGFLTCKIAVVLAAFRPFNFRVTKKE